MGPRCVQALSSGEELPVHQIKMVRIKETVKDGLFHSRSLCELRYVAMDEPAM